MAASASGKDAKVPCGPNGEVYFKTVWLVDDPLEFVQKPPIPGERPGFETVIMAKPQAMLKGPNGGGVTMFQAEQLITDWPIGMCCASALSCKESKVYLVHGDPDDPYLTFDITNPPNKERSRHRPIRAEVMMCLVTEHVFGCSTGANMRQSLMDDNDYDSEPRGI